METKQKFCTKCGKVLSSNSKFCSNCGAKTQESLRESIRIKNSKVFSDSLIITLCVSLFLYIIIGLMQSSVTYWAGFIPLFLFSFPLLGFIIHGIRSKN